MKFLWFGKQKDKGVEAKPEAIKCAHPIDHQVAVHQDQSKIYEVTAMKCTQCGAILPLDKSKGAR